MSKIIQKSLQSVMKDDVLNRPNYDGFVVIGAGLPRTGTTSIRSALATLLNGSCYHMMCVAEGTRVEEDFWLKALNREIKSDEEWRKFFEGRGYRAGVDFPVSFFYRDMLRAFPKAKVILTVRNPETWYKSVRETIYEGNKKTKDFAVRLFMQIAGKTNLVEVIDRTAWEPAEGATKGVLVAIDEGLESSIDFFQQWNNSVRKTVPKERLLEFDPKQGWSPLCEFLGVPVPDIPFPRLNDTKDMNRKLAGLSALAYSVVYGLPILLLMVLLYFFYF
ncbi:hypothetical protein TCAL_09468 [Tigriopus californicus]|uniref:Sulfotransferase domain-containing protein n=1 Tax=Tigriopus californicus TaxID=6832 RepID=A0A553PM49_TIGCA|nr:uncharacterized protein LOC131890015 isoform X1 [Tigriopus californicus]TRY78754.1 hypothetical protein TCAL_09468 [Tigriopus californicus]|eukprot:TCALIF_09468-PA protein Name:"Protein of unknown function" AED:0.00 eAED:0.00 QI:114/1/1/1/0.5/0.66/3/108/275